MKNPLKLSHARTLSVVFLAICIGLLAFAAGLKFQPDFSLHDIVEHQTEAFVLQDPLPTSAGETGDEMKRLTNATEMIKIVPGAKVKFLGQTIGIIEKVLLADKEGNPIEPDPRIRPEDYRLLGKLKLRGEFAKLLSKNSIALLNQDYGGFGGIYLELVSPPGEPLGPEIVKVSHAMNVRSEINALLWKIDDQADQIFSTIPGILKDTEEIVGLAKKMISDLDEGQTTRSMGEIVQKINALELQETERGLKQSVESLNELLVSMRGKVDALDVKDIKKLLNSLERTSDAAQESFLLRGGLRRVEAREARSEQELGDETPATSRKPAR